MDPQACLQRILDAITDGEWEEAEHACEDLYNWLKRGGFPPTVKPNTFISIGNVVGDAYSILTYPDRAEFTYWERKSDLSNEWQETHRFPLSKSAQ